MIKLGEYNNLKVKRKAEFGYFLDAGTGNTSDDVLLHKIRKKIEWTLGIKTK